MTPAARIQTAIDCLDMIAQGEPAERVLTRWARASRHAGSKDRAAVRDHVFDVLRRWWSSAARGGGDSGRARMIGALSEMEADLAAIFTGTGYAPAPLTDADAPRAVAHDDPVLHDCPPPLDDDLRRSLGAEFAPVMEALRHRAPTFLRVNTRAGDVETAARALMSDGIETRPCPLSPTALKVTANARAVARSRAYLDGAVELQDAASQALVDALPLQGARRILDYCAGGGGKTLAMAARHDAGFCAYDIDPARLDALRPRAERAGIPVRLLSTADLAEQTPFDVVLVDAPCTGSGAWRRNPEGKVRITQARLDELCALQGEVLEAAAAHVAPGGVLAYATCSMIDRENADRVATFLGSHPDLELQQERRWLPTSGADGFYLAVMGRAAD